MHDHSCALGAALDAVGAEQASGWAAERMFPIFSYARRITCPVTSRCTELLLIIADLNDNHRWTRERIADWVESVERELEGPAATSPELLSVAVTSS